MVELASNDGYLLKNFIEVGVPVLGVDPAPHQASAANAERCAHDGSVLRGGAG
ncbi:MAG: hypothetical protein U5R31_15660 [Acidimicrobiia bacterium]|nr:hypothetical protein [Acidimicrobiia bacterium]